MVKVEVVIHFPVSPRLDDAIPHRKDMSRLELVDPLEEGLSSKTELERQVIIQPIKVRLDIGNEGKQGLGFGREIEQTTMHGVIERLYSEWIPRTDEALPALIPKCKGKHASKLIETLDTPFTVRMQNRLGIGMRTEQVAAQ